MRCFYAFHFSLSKIFVIYTRFFDLLSISSNWWLQCPSIINCRNLPRQMELTLRSFFIRLNTARSFKTPMKQKGVLEVFALLLVALRLYGYLHLSLHLKLSLWSEPILFLIKCCWTWHGEQLKKMKPLTTLYACRYVRMPLNAQRLKNDSFPPLEFICWCAPITTQCQVKLLLRGYKRH